MTNNDIYNEINVCFLRINSGTTYYVPCVNSIQSLIDSFDGNAWLVSTDMDGGLLPDDKWSIIDRGGNHLIDGRESVESQTGVLEYEGNHYIVKRLTDITQEDVRVILEADLNGMDIDHMVLSYVATKI